MTKESYTHKEVEKLLSDMKTNLRKSVFAFISSQIDLEDKQKQEAAISFMEDKSEYYQDKYDKCVADKELLWNLRAKINNSMDMFDIGLGETL